MSAEELRDAGSGCIEELGGTEAADQPSSPLSETDLAAAGDSPDNGLAGCELAAVLEALLFVSPEPVPVSRFRAVAGSRRCRVPR